MAEQATDENLEERVLGMCPRAAGKFQRTSPRTRAYNCFAWAVGDTEQPWVPGGDPLATRWPPNAPRQLDLASILTSFEHLGFSRCQGIQVEPGVERIALFMDLDGDVIHAARQLPDGRWTSKLGVWEDIEHDDLTALEGGDYGRVAAVLKRVVTPDEVPK